MLKVNNKKTIQQVAKSSFRANKLRNLFAVVAIVLTTVLFTGIFTVATSLMASMEESTMRQVGGSAHGTFKYLSEEQYNTLKNHPSIESISYSVVLGIAENEALAKRPTEIRYVSDEAGAKGMFSMPTTGRLPQNEDEIATDTIVLDRLGIAAELGEKVTLEYSLGGEKRTGTFTLVGFWSGDVLMMASQAWLSRGYVEAQLVNYIPADENDIVGVINADVNFANSFDIEGKLNNVIRESGYTPDDIAIGVNWAYTGNSGSKDLGTILGGVMVILTIVFCGYLIISNVFLISVTKDIRFYGLLKTIGTTGKQIRILIRRQALLLCAIGIPIGLLAGYFVGAILTPLVLSVLNTNVIKVSVNPLVFIIAALFAMLTVFLSIAKPSKLAAKVSPIEALRSTDGSQPSKKATKKSGGVSLRRMAQGNVFRNKKKALLVTISLSLSLILLNATYSIANSFDMDSYISGMIGSDFVVGDVSNFNVHMHYSNQDTLSSGFLAGLSERQGIEKMSNIYFAEPSVATDPRLADLPARAEALLNMEGEWLEYLKGAIKNPSQPQHIYGLDANVLEKLTVFEGKIDHEKLGSGDYIIAAAYDTEGKLYYYNIGDKVQVANDAGAVKEYEVLAIASLPYNISTQHSHPIQPEYFLPSDIFLQDIAGKAPMLTTLDVADANEVEMEQYLAEYCAKIDPNMQYGSKATYAVEYESTQRTYKAVGTILSLLVAFIGVMNFINTVLTSIIARRRELAMLQSIGMTRKQTQTMLMFEGIVYTALTALFALTIGSVLGYLGVYAFTSGSLYMGQYFTVVPSLLCLPILAIISILVPYVSGAVIGKSSVIERLRDVE